MLKATYNIRKFNRKTNINNNNTQPQSLPLKSVKINKAKKRNISQTKPNQMIACIVKANL